LGFIGSRHEDSGIRTSGFGFGVQGLGFRAGVQGLRVKGFGFRVWGLGLRVKRV
jgi:hypothetical protein